jgi:hypothetical protein
MKKIIYSAILFIGISTMTTAQIDALSSIKKFLKTTYPKTYETSRNFVYNEIDLNDDGKNEYVVGLIGGEWCGSGGCTMLVLTNTFKLNTKMTVVEFPLYIGAPASPEVTKKYSNIYIQNRDGSVAKMAWNGVKYPTNPSTAPKVNKKIIDGKYKFLNETELALNNF